MVDLQLLQVDGKLDISRGHYVLDLEVRVSNGEAHLLDDFGVLATGQLALLLRTRPCYHHLTRTEDKPSGFRVAEAHDDGGEAIGVVLSGLAFPGDLLQV
jgi:hypothetical protein